MKYIGLILLFLYLFIDNTFASCTFGICNVDPELQTGGNKDMEESIKNLLNYFLGFIAFIGVAFVIKGGFQILTAAGDDEKVKSGRKTILYALLGIFIVFMSGIIVDSVFTAGETISK